jgi:hypothetical protein
MSQRSPAATSMVSRAAGLAPEASYGSCARYVSMKVCSPVRLGLLLSS